MILTKPSIHLGLYKTKLSEYNLQIYESYKEINWQYFYL